MLTSARPSVDEDGFSVIEMVIVLLIASIVLATAVGALISLQKAESRNDSLVQEEQAASSVMAQMERDLRSASSITIPAGASSADQVQLAIMGAGGSTTNVLWVHDATTATLTRKTQTGGVFVASGFVLNGVSNGVSNPVFSYFSGPRDISSTTPSNIAECATAVGIDAEVSSATAGMGSFEETAEVALTDQAQTLSDGGGQACGQV